MLKIETNRKTDEMTVDISGTANEILVELASVVGAVLTRPQFTDDFIELFDIYYKKWK